MKHIITGGDGFLGTELAKKLVARGEKVLALDIKKTDSPHYDDIDFMMVDITDKEALATVPVDDDDIVYHFAARLLVPIMKRAERHEYFFSVLYEGTKNVLDYLESQTGCRKVIYYTTDMVYGHTLENPRPESHKRCLLYTSPSPRDATLSRMPSSA